MRVAVACLLSAALACGGGRTDRDEPAEAPAAEPAPPAPGQPTRVLTEADLERYWQLMVAIGDAARTGDCATKAAAINRVIAEHEELLELRRGIFTNENLSKRWVSEYGARADELMRDVFDNRLAGCLREPALADAIAKLRE